MLAEFFSLRIVQRNQCPRKVEHHIGTYLEFSRARNPRTNLLTCICSFVVNIPLVRFSAILRFVLSHYSYRLLR